MDEATWNVLHDGRVVRADGVVPGELRLSVEIAYLCGHLPTEAEHVTVTLAGCERFEYQSYQEPPVFEPSAVAALGLELLSAGPAEAGLNIECADGRSGGRLLFRYKYASMATAEGRPQSELESASEGYWTLWQQRHAARGAAADGGA